MRTSRAAEDRALPSGATRKHAERHPWLLGAGLLVAGALPACVSNSGTGSARSLDASAPADGGAVTPLDASGSSAVDAGVRDASVGETGAAGGVAITVPVLGSGFNYHQASYSLGWAFVVNSTVQVTHLGFYDDVKTDGGVPQDDGGPAGTDTQSHPVGIYDKATQQLLAQVTVSPTDPLTGFFRYAPLAAPLTLTAGSTYVIMANVGSDTYLAFTAFDPAWTVNPAITYAGSAVNYANPAATTLLYPDTFTPNQGDFGPNFLF